MRQLLLLCFSLACTPAIHAQADSGTGGSGTVGTPVTMPASGTRLKIQYLETDDGARVPYGYFDTQLDAGCYFASTPDAGTRCINADYPGSDPSVFIAGTLKTL